MTYFAYQYAPANVVNVIKLSSIMLTALFGWLFLQERLSRRELLLMCAVLVVLLLFVGN
ncbi:MAG: EamA family transporter [Candidatus Peribacteria bacterium]|nr:MAG: EamA family transporter [Candidatus Peribacteria bacterium]